LRRLPLARRGGTGIMRRMGFGFSSLHGRNRRILVSGGIGVAQRFAQLGASLVILPVTLHTLGVAGFGVWGAATSLSWAAGMLDLGLGGALVTLLPALRQSGEDARDYVTACLLSGTVIGLVLLASGGAGLLLWPGHAPSPPFLIAWVCLALNIPLGLAGSLWFGRQKGHVAGMWELAQTLLMLGFILAGAWAHAGPGVMTLCVFGAALLPNAGSLCHFLLTQEALRPRLRPNFTVLGRALRSGAVLAAISIAAACAYVFDNVLTLHWLGPEAAAQMTIAMRMCVTALGFLLVATQALWPEFVAAVAQNDHGWVARTLRRGTLAVLVLAGVGSALIVQYGGWAVRLWLHQDLHLPPVLFLAMAGWIVMMALPRVPGLLLNAAARYRAQLAAQCAATALALAAKFLLFQRFGAAGILAATPLAWLVLLCPVYGWAAYRLVTATQFKKA